MTHNDRYIFTQKVGDFNINYPVILTPEEYDALVTKENVKSYYKEKIDAFDEKRRLKMQKIYYLSITSNQDYLKQSLAVIQ